MGRRVHFPAAAALTAMLAALLTGCGGGSSAHHHARPTTPVHLALAASTTPLAAQIPAQPIASMPSSVSGVTLQLYAAQRQSGGGVLVVFALDVDAAAAKGDLTPIELDEGMSANGNAGTGSSGTTASDVALFDPSGLKEYETFMSDPSKDDTCLCTVTGGLDNSIGSVGTHMIAALDAAPPAGEDTVSVVTGLGTFGNVTLTQ